MSLIEKLALSTAAGGISGGISKTSVAPIERIKLLLQNQNEMLKQGTINRPYTGIIDCTVHTFKNEGLLPFWRGNLTDCIRHFPATVCLRGFSFVEIIVVFVGFELCLERQNQSNVHTEKK